MLSIIITAWKEPKTLSRNLESILDPVNYNLPQEFEIILVCPDDESRDAAKAVVDRYGVESRFVHIRDPQKGKPYALNMAFQRAKGDIWICTDGDVIIGKNAIQPLINPILEDDLIGLVSGRPVSLDSQDCLFGYLGGLLADVAHEKRLTEQKNKRDYFVAGGLFAMRRINGIRVPEEVLCDDGWITLKFISMGFRVGYVPEACVYVKYPKNFRDWIRQKRRSAGGYMQLGKYRLFSKDSPKRDIFEEIKYFFFPLRYAHTPKQFLYSLMLYPMRLVLWMVIFYDRMSKNHLSKKLWKRVESTK